MAIQTPYLKVDEHGIDLIKNHQISRHIEYREISLIEIKKGHLIKNWKIVLIIGTITAIGAILLGIYISQFFDYKLLGTRHIKGIVMTQISPWILMAGGLFLIIQSLRKCKIVVISTREKNYQISINEIDKESKMEEFIDFLSKRTLLKTAD